MNVFVPRTYTKCVHNWRASFFSPTYVNISLKNHFVNTVILYAVSTSRVVDTKKKIKKEKKPEFNN